VADLGEGPGGSAPPPFPLFWVKEEEITEGRKAGRASKTKPGAPLSSMYGSATGNSSHSPFLQTIIFCFRADQCKVLICSPLTNPDILVLLLEGFRARGEKVTEKIGMGRSLVFQNWVSV